METQIIDASTTTAIATTATRIAVSSTCVTTSGAISSATRFITLINGFSAGPAVSLNGSPTVSPITAALWDSLLASVVPLLDELLRVVPRTPELDSITASSWPVRIEPARNAPRPSAPRKNPAITGLSTARSPGVVSSRSEVCVQMSTTRP